MTQVIEITDEHLSTLNLRRVLNNPTRITWNRDPAFTNIPKLMDNLKSICPYTLVVKHAVSDIILPENTDGVWFVSLRTIGFQAPKDRTWYALSNNLGLK